MMMMTTVYDDGGGSGAWGEWLWGSGRSCYEDHFWSWPENSPEKFSGGGWSEKVAVVVVPVAGRIISFPGLGQTEKLSGMSFHIKLL
ncbi:hypothetical protein Tco_0987645 [Tanacetum coccineum]